MQEKWNTIKDFPKYEVSNTGKIRNKKTQRNLRIRVLRDYKVVGLVDGKTGTQKTVFVHRCVASAFVDNPLGLPIINHKDGNKLNNCADNLEWCTYSQNTLHAYKIGLIKPINHPNKKPVKQIDKSGNVIKVFASCWEAEKATGIRHIHEVRMGQRQSAGGYAWKDA